MAQTIGQHGVAAFTSPVNGDLLNATVVLSNDNTTRSAYVDHDIDSGIHVQSSLLAARPAAGTAGRKWMTTDTGDVSLWFDTGAAWEEIAYVPSVGGNAATATALQTPRNINGVAFDGTANITVTAAAGTVTGATLASNVLASSLTSVGTLSGLTVTAPITGSVTGASGSTTGNAATATALQTARTINGTSFDGTANVTVTADASTLTGATLASGVTASSLTSVGTLTALTTSGTTSLATSAGAVSVRSVAYTFPASQGAASTILTNDGSGTLTWTAPASGPAAAGTLTGATLASNVLASSLTSVGTLTSLGVTGTVTASSFTGAGTGLTGTASSLTTGGNAVLGANTFTAAQEWATGTAIASAATINLNTATGNRVHITGTTAITAVTLTRGPRTVIFDGILTLTHNATTNNLPGAANITTAVGDRAVYESDGTTVYCSSYTKASGQPVVAAPAGFTLGTPIATTSGTSHDFTGIPATATHIVLNFSGVSTNDAQLWIVQLGDSGGIETSGYLSASGNAFGGSRSTLGFVIQSQDFNNLCHGSYIFTYESSSANRWCGSGVIGTSNSDNAIYCGGAKSLSGTLDRIRLTTVTGAATFDAGEINIAYF